MKEIGNKDESVWGGAQKPFLRKQHQITSLNVKCEGRVLCASVNFSSVTQSCPTLCDPIDCSIPGFPVHHQLPEFTQTHVHWVNDAIHHLILCRPFLLLPSIFPSIRVFSDESVLRIRWPKYWSFSFSISPSNEYQDSFPLGLTGWISLQSKELSRVFSNTTVKKHQFFGALFSLYSNSHIHTQLLEKP